MQKKEHGRPSKENNVVKLTTFSGSAATAKAVASEKRYCTKTKKKVFR